MRARWLGRVAYGEAWDLQRAVAGRSTEEYLLLLEHPAVYTLGRHADESHVLIDPVTVGARAVRVDRGGDVTYHGPGQLIGYPVMNIEPGPHRGPEHVRRMEGVVIDALVDLGLAADDIGRLVGFPGVWVGLRTSERPRKICAVGVRTAGGRTTHGFALNVSPDLTMFDHIIPCGLEHSLVTSLEAEGIDVAMTEAVEAVFSSAQRAWGLFEDIQRVTGGSTAPRAGVGPSQMVAAVPVAFSGGGGCAGTERSLDRRLRQAGVEPAAGLPMSGRKPAWLLSRIRMGGEFLGLKNDLRHLDLVTVCEEAGCPNISECWSEGTATLMINGSRCTRACGFCQIDTRRPLPLDPDEPGRVAEAVARMGLAHAVVTCVARDDLEDGGAGAFATTIAAVRDRCPNTTVEVLISDLKGDHASLQVVIDARPDVLNHNIETVARLQRAVRPSAGYARSLTVLARAKDAGLVTKSGLMVGMGEHEDEVIATLSDLRAVGVDHVTIGQYLRPSASHLPVARWWTPLEFERLDAVGTALGFAHVQASPLTRSSYHARATAEPGGEARAFPRRSPSSPTADQGAVALAPTGR